MRWQLEEFWAFLNCYKTQCNLPERSHYFFVVEEIWKAEERKPMAFLSFIGRVLFVSVFMLSAWQEYTDFGENGGAAAVALKPKFDVLSKHVVASTRFQLPPFEMKYLVATAVVLKAFGSVFFMVGSTFGAYLLLFHQIASMRILYDFYNYDVDSEEFAHLFTKFLENLALVGALLFFIGIKNSMLRRQAKRKAASKAKTM